MKAYLLASVSSALLAVTFQTAAAQNVAPQAQGAGDDQLTEIIVTANKREERLIDTPQTINVVSGEQLQKFNATRFDDLVRFVPGLEISNSGTRTAAVSLRGVQFNPDSQTTSTVDIYLNEVPFDPTQAIQAQFDIGSVQVLRGPQGTLRGQTGPSGAILIGTRKPNLTKIEVNGSANYTDRGAVNLQAGVSVPLIADKLAIRLAGLYDWNPLNGIHNITNGRDEFNRSYGGRASIEFQPTPDLNFLLVHQEFRGKNESFYGVVSDPNSAPGRFGLLTVDDRNAVTLGGTDQRTKGSGTILNATWDFSGHRLTYLGSYQDNDADQTIDLNVGNVRTPAYLNFVVPGLGNYEYQQYQNIRINTQRLTNEVRFERTGDHFWIYRAGIFFEDTKTHLEGVIDYTGANGGCVTNPGPLALLGLPCLNLSGGVDPKQHNRGFFTTQTFNFTDRDTLDLGLRYSTARVDNPPNDQRFHAWTGSASYKHEFSPGLIAYATYGRSFRPGGFDSSGANTASGANSLPTSVFRWRSERSDTYEIGTKGELFGRRLTYALSGFIQKFDGFINRFDNIACTGNPNGTGPLPGTVYNTTDGQAPNGANSCANTGTVNLTYNADAIVRGVELDLRGQITRGWTGQVTMAYVDAHYSDALIPCNDYNGDGTPDQNGTPAVQAGQQFSLCRSSGQLSAQPKFQGTFNTEYRFGIKDGFDAYVRALGRYSASTTIATTGQKIGSLFTMDGFVGVTTPVGAEIGLFLRNIFDQRNDIVSVSQSYDVFGQASGYRSVTYSPRREFGLLARVDF